MRKYLDFGKAPMQRMANGKVPKSLCSMVPLVGAFGVGLYSLTDGAPVSMHINAVFNRAVLRDDAPEYLYKHKQWDWLGQHPPMSGKKLRHIFTLLPDRIFAFDIWRQDEAGVLRFHSGFWRKSQDQLKETWIEPSQEAQFTHSVGLIGSVAANSNWDYQMKLSENDRFLRAFVKESNISHGHGLKFEGECLEIDDENGNTYILALYSNAAPISTAIVRAIEETLVDP